MIENREEKKTERGRNGVTNLNHRFCEYLLINLQDSSLDFFIRETKRSQENGCMGNKTKTS